MSIELTPAQRRELQADERREDLEEELTRMGYPRFRATLKTIHWATANFEPWTHTQARLADAGLIDEMGSEEGNLQWYKLAMGYQVDQNLWNIDFEKPELPTITAQGSDYLNDNNRG